MKIITLESSLSDRDRISGEQSRDLELEKAWLLGKVAALEQAATDERRTLADALKKTVRLMNTGQWALIMLILPCLPQFNNNFAKMDVFLIAWSLTATCHVC